MHSLSNRVYNYNVSILARIYSLSSLPSDMTTFVASCQLYPSLTTTLCMQPSSSLNPIASFPFTAATLLCSAAVSKPLDLPSVSSSFCNFNRLVGCPPLPSTDNITDTHLHATASSDLVMMRTDAGFGFNSTSNLFLQLEYQSVTNHRLFYPYNVPLLDHMDLASPGASAFILTPYRCDAWTHSGPVVSSPTESVVSVHCAVRTEPS